MSADDNTTPTNRSSKLDVIASQVTYMVKSIDELKDNMKKFEDKRSTEWLEYSVAHKEVVDKVASLETKVATSEVDTKTKFTTLTSDITKLKEAVAPLVVSNKILVWIGGILGASIIIFIWGLITHAVQIATP